MRDLAVHTDNTLAPLLVLAMLLVLGGLLAARWAVSIMRVARGREPREKQLSRLAARLDGRERVSIRTVEFGVAEADLRWVAQSRGYGLVKHPFAKFYEFVRVPGRP
ncbi:hypothetical protein [Amycolatopsis sp. NPDC004625]|uniref:hypothetical protein n=1 Tax=Amycolatopsis sp. NPDC004625 TaxID=3154670 RepID=UPI0033B2AC02